MAYAFVAQNDAWTSAAGFTQTINVTLAAGETVEAIVLSTTASGTHSVSDGTNTYSKIGAEFDNASGMYGSWHYLHNVSAGTVTLTATYSASSSSRSIAYIRSTGLENTAPQTSVYRAQTETAGADVMTSNNLTPSSQPAILRGFCWDNNSAFAISAGSGFNNRGLLATRNSLEGATSRIEDKRLTATSAVAATFTTSNGGSNDWIFAAIFSELIPPTAVPSSGLNQKHRQAQARRRAPRYRMNVRGWFGPKAYIQGWFWRGWAPTTTSDVTVALSGAAATASGGTLAPSNSPALSGQAATAAQGSVTASQPLVGSAATASPGTLTPNTSPALAGASATATPGTATAANSVALAGSGNTAAAGTVTAAFSVAVAGQAATASPGTLSPTAAVGLSGLSCTATAGTAVPSITIALSGLAMTTATGTVSASSPGGSALTGSQVSTATGTLTPSVTFDLTGSGVTASPGAVTATLSKAISGQSATVARGDLVPAVAITPNGQAITASGGALSPSITGLLAGGGIVVSLGTLLGSTTDKLFIRTAGTSLAARAVGSESAASASGSARGRAGTGGDASAAAATGGDSITNPPVTSES